MKIFPMTHNFCQKILFNSAVLWLSSLKQQSTTNSERLTTTEPIAAPKIKCEKKEYSNRMIK